MSTATEVIVELPPLGDGDNWAEVATDAWLVAARDAGLDVDVVSIEVEHPDLEAALVENRGIRYVLTILNRSEVRAELHLPPEDSVYFARVGDTLVPRLRGPEYGQNRLGTDLGDGVIALNDSSVAVLLSLTEDEDGHLELDLKWTAGTIRFGGEPYPVTRQTRQAGMT